MIPVKRKENPFDFFMHKAQISNDLAFEPLFRLDYGHFEKKKKKMSWYQNLLGKRNVVDLFAEGITSESKRCGVLFSELDVLIDSFSFVTSGKKDRIKNETKIGRGKIEISNESAKNLSFFGHGIFDFP